MGRIRDLSDISHPRTPGYDSAILRIPRIYLEALALYLISRAVVLLAIYFASQLIPMNPSGDNWNLGPAWYGSLLRYDSGWYLLIAERGYSYDSASTGQQPVVFFPLYPLLARGVGFVFGNNPVLGMLAVSNVAVVVAVLLLCRLVRERFGDAVALLSVACVSFFPTSLFFSAGYTESLTLLFVLLCFLCLRQQRFYFAAVCAGLALATRTTGILLLLPLTYALWQALRKEPRRLVVHGAACTIIASSGLWGFMLYLAYAFGDPLAFATAQKSWTVGQGAGGNLFAALTLQPFTALQNVWSVGPNSVALEPWLFLTFLVLLVVFWRRLPREYGLFALGVLLLPYLTFSGSVGFRSAGRYVLLAFPVFVLLADLLAKRAWLAFGVLGVSAAMLFMYTACFAHWYWAG